jgi:hypothetical protein
MSDSLIYVPHFRVREQEKQVVSNFLFPKQMIPYLEIIKETGRKAPTMRKGKALPPKPVKPFEKVYGPVIDQIRARKVFVDLPVHMRYSGQTKPEVIAFLKGVVEDRDVRTKYMLKFQSQRDKVIPVISSYYQKTGEIGSIKKQVDDLRPHFGTLAFRTYAGTYKSDWVQLKDVLQPQDYLFFDLDSMAIDFKDDDILDIQAALRDLTHGRIVVVRSAIDESLKYTGLTHAARITALNNRLLEHYHDLGADSFGDYVCIKKDTVPKGGGKVSPGFIYYNPIDNDYYGFRGTLTNGKSDQNLDDFVNIIAPSVIHSSVSQTLLRRHPDFVRDNPGWDLMNRIGQKLEPGKSAGKFKRISMEHYLHCMKVKIMRGELT